MAAGARRFWWILGIILLAGSFGFGWFLNNGPLSFTNGPAAAQPSAASDNEPERGIVAIGFVDVEGGVAALHPTQVGRIVSVVSEGKTVTKGDVILQIDDRFAKYKLAEAKAGLAASKQQLKQAQMSETQRQEKIKQQNTAIKVAKQKLNIAKLKLDIANRRFKATLIKQDELDILVEGVQLARSAIEAEQQKLDELKTIDTQSGIERARQDIEAKKAQVLQAELAVDECKLRAHEDGTVLRVLVTAGEVLGKNPRQPAIMFAPKPKGGRMIRAEVLQEFANRVSKGQVVKITDDTRHGTEWQGVVKRVSKWIAPKREKILEPFMLNDVRTLECWIEVSEGKAPMRIGQRVRVRFLDTDPVAKN